MCDAKHFFEQPAVEDSRVFAQLGRTLGWQGLTNEAKHNEQNPGRAITKAGINAALWYLGSEAGGLGGSGNTTDAAINAAELGSASEGASLYGSNAGNVADLTQALSSAGGGSSMSTQALKELATQESLDTGLLGSGGNPNLMQLAQMNAPVSDLSVQAQTGPLSTMQDYAARLYGRGRDATSNAMNAFGRTAPVQEQANAPVYDASVNAARSGGNGAMKNLALQTGMKMLMPEQQAQQPRAMPMQGPPAPMPNPYGQPMTGQARVINGSGLTEQQKAALRAQGYTVY